MRDIKSIVFLTFFSGCLVASAAMPIGSNFWHLTEKSSGRSWTGELPFWAQVNFSSAYRYNLSTKLSNYSPWYPKFIKDVRDYRCFRMMDWSHINGSGQKSWNSRKKPNQSQYGYGDYRDTNGSTTGMAYEWQIDLCNRLNRDLWVNVPLLADNSYMWNLGRLIKDKLKPNLKVYVELHNEFWLQKNISGTWKNTTRYGRDEANRLGLGGRSDFEKALHWYVNRSTYLWKHFEWAFGTSQYNSRVRAVIGGQSANVGMATVIRNALGNRKINPYRIMPYGYAIAPYFGQDANTRSWGSIDRQITRSINNVRDNRLRWSGSGVRILCYEGGQHITGGSGNVALNKSWTMYHRYKTRYLPGVSAQIGGWNIFVHYVNVGRYSSNEFWGSKSATGQGYTTHGYKNRALREYMGVPVHW